MAIVTLCPQCQTAFAIQAEHYSAADAWVRCGRCAHVFEVDQHLFELDGEPEVPVVVKERPVVQYLAATTAPTVGVTQSAFHPAVWLAAGLVVLLGLQSMVHSRDHLAATMPELRSTLTVLCEPMNCEVRWPMSPDNVSMETGTFKRIDANLYSFEGVIKNASAFPVWMPTLELTLTDSDDTAVVRKVITPSDMGLADGLRAGRSQGFEIKFTVDAAFSSRIIGYRSVLFYP
jgi:predicted Zn finger-like uncharacterized protein